MDGKVNIRVYLRPSAVNVMGKTMMAGSNTRRRRALGTRKRVVACESFSPRQRHRVIKSEPKTLRACWAGVPREDGIHLQDYLAILCAALIVLVLASVSPALSAASTVLTFSDRPYAETPLPADYGRDDQISLSWSTNGQPSPRITSTGQSPFSDHSPDGTGRFIFAQGTSIIQFNPTVRLARLFVRDNEPDFIQASATGLTVRGELRSVPAFLVPVDFVPKSQSGVWIEIVGSGAIDTLFLISPDDLTKSYLLDDIEFEVYSETEVIALAGHNQTVIENSAVTLDGSESLNAHSFLWAQVRTGSDPEVTLSSPNEAVATFIAPDVHTATLLTFELMAVGPLGFDSDWATVVVNISTPPATPPQNLTGTPKEAGQSLMAVVEWSAHPDATRYVVYRAEGDPENEYVRVAPSISVTSYDDVWLEEGIIYFYRVVAANQFGVGPASDPVALVASRNLALESEATPIARILNPTGSGLRDIESIRNGLTEENYDSYHGGVKETEDWYGYLWDEPRYFDTITYYEGKNFPDGGWWTRLTVQNTIDGSNWVEVTGLSISPSYNYADTRTGRVSYTRLHLTFDRCRGVGVRIYGEPGGVADFTSIAELEVYGDQAPDIVVADAGSDLQADEGTSVTLHGENSLNAVGFLWQQLRLGDEPQVVLTAADTPNPTFVVRDISKNTVFTFRLTLSGFHGPKSDTVTVTIINKEPPGPTQGLSATGGHRKVDLSWQPNNEATSYKILRSTALGGGGGVIATGVTATSYVDKDPDLKPFHAYYYQVVGVNIYGDGSASNVAAAAPIENFALYPDAAPVARVTNPTGSGQKDLNIIRNGVYEEKGYDSYDGPNPATEDWYGYLWSDPIYPDSVVYTMGRNYLDGGWWTSLTVEYTTDGESWQQAQNVTITPPYNFEDNRYGRPDYSRYTLTFDRVRALGLRIYGEPGGIVDFTSIVELEVYGLDAPVACSREIVPLFYVEDSTVNVNLNLEAHEFPAPNSVTVTELIPPETLLADSGGGSTAVPGQITWNLDLSQVHERGLSYAIAIPAGLSGRLQFDGRVSYGSVANQRIRGEDSLYPRPLPPRNVRLETDLVGHLRWSPSTQEGIVGYHVYRSVNGQGYEDISGLISQTFFDDLGVETGAAYRYKVTTENAAGVENELAESQSVGPAPVTMLRREFEDYNYGGGLFPGGQGRTAIRASSTNDLTANKDYFFHDGSVQNSYRPGDSLDIRQSLNGGYSVADVLQGDWWRFSFNLSEQGYVKIADLHAASSEEATYEFFWDENLVGTFSFNTGGEANWRTHQMDSPSFLSPPGVHTLRIRAASGRSNDDYFGIGFGWAAPTREIIFSDNFHAYATTDEVVAQGGWTILNGSSEPEGAWRLWTTSGPPLAEGEPGPGFPGFSSGYMVCNGDFAGGVQLDEELISPEIDCTRYLCVAAEFVSAINIYDQDSEGDLQTTDFDLSIYDEESQSWSDWVNVFTRDRTGGDDFTAIPKWFDLSHLADGRKVRFRWRFYNTRDDYWWAVDGVKVSGEKRSPRILSATLTQGNSLVLTWEAFGSGRYTVEFRDDLGSGTWQPVPGTSWPISGTTWRDDNPAPEGRRFYRVRSD